MLPPNCCLPPGGVAAGPQVPHPPGRVLLRARSRVCRRHELNRLLDAVRVHDDREELLPDRVQAQGLRQGDHLGAVGLHHRQLLHRHHPGHRVQINL